MDRALDPPDCPLCERECPSELMERHHLRTRKRDRAAVARICRQCHRTIHALYDNVELRDPARGLDTLEGLLAEPRFARALGFIRKTPSETYVRTRGARPRRRARRR